MENIAKLNQSLQPGNYMRVDSVLNYLYHSNVKSTLADIIKKVSIEYRDRSNVYYKTSDLKSIIEPNLFREMECYITTYSIN